MRATCTLPRSQMQYCEKYANCLYLNVSTAQPSFWSYRFREGLAVALTRVRRLFADSKRLLAICKQLVGRVGQLRDKRDRQKCLVRVASNVLTAVLFRAPAQDVHIRKTNATADQCRRSENNYDSGYA
jgi:hypothetical protein